MANTAYKRILLKLSGESLQGKQNYGHDVEVLKAYAEQIKTIRDMGVEIGIVIGGGNIFRGIQGAGRGFDQAIGVNSLEHQARYMQVLSYASCSCLD